MIRVTDDKGLEREVRQALKENDGYCPCAVVHTPDTKCPCKAFREREETGSCHCGLYVKV